MEIRNKIFEFKVSLDKDTYRIFKIKGSTTLYKLANTITDLFGFDLDHLFEFHSKKKTLFGIRECYELKLPADMDLALNPDAKDVKKTQIYKVFEKGKSFTFRYDFGDNWEFDIKCKSISNANLQEVYPMLVKEYGVAPEQYDYDEEPES